MKVMKLALLGTAALAAVTVSARADDLSDLKAQIEALQADVAALQAAPAIPAGYSLLTMSEAPAIVVPGREGIENLSKTATTIGVLPTADMPASTVIQWTGQVRAALTYRDHETNEDGATVNSDTYTYDENHIKARGLLLVTGTTDTAVGEVGASIEFLGLFDGEGVSYGEDFYMDYAWGWWKMTPELTFAGGYNVSLARIDGFGMRKIDDSYISRGGVGVDSDGGFTQFQLRYDSGPIGIHVAVEHTDEDGNGGSSSGEGSNYGVAGEVTYSGDMFRAEVAGYLRDDGDENESQIGIGIGTKLSDMFDVSVAASMSNNIEYTQSDGELAAGDGWRISGAVVATLSDSISAEVGAGWSSFGDNEWDAGDGDTDTMAIAGGVFWSPVTQLKMGVQASYVTMEEDNWNDDSTDLQAAFVTWWNF